MKLWNVCSCPLGSKDFLSFLPVHIFLVCASLWIIQLIRAYASKLIIKVFLLKLQLHNNSLYKDLYSTLHVLILIPSFTYWNPLLWNGNNMATCVIGYFWSKIYIHWGKFSLEALWITAFTTAQLQGVTLMDRDSVVFGTSTQMCRSHAGLGCLESNSHLQYRQMWTHSQYKWFLSSAHLLGIKLTRDFVKQRAIGRKYFIYLGINGLL